MTMQITSFTFAPVSMLTQGPRQLQRIELSFDSTQSGHVLLNIRQGEQILEEQDIAILSGRYRTFTLLPPPQQPSGTFVEVRGMAGEILATAQMTWLPPRKWTFYVMISSHTDIGLHNSQYIQRHNSADFLDKAVKLVDETSSWPEESRYHYCMEGTWFWENYALERNPERAQNIATNYIKTGKIGVAAGLAGNCTQLYSTEELCRSAYLRKSLKTKWDIDSETMTMIDNNGLSWGLVGPYAQAGYKNIFWAPNPWNPLQSTLYTKDMDVYSGTYTPEACASGSRCDVRYDSALPMVFYWQGADGHSKLLVWTSTQYDHGGDEFGISSRFTGEKATLPFMEMKIVRQLEKLERKYPYDIWLLASYGDDEEPNLTIAERIRQWNSKWAWPQIRMTGNLDTPFNLLRQRFDKDIPTLRGEITGGWYQLALSAPEILAQKFAADHALAAAEVIASMATYLKTGYRYPKQAFQRAWQALLCNDEHSYGCSGYKGRRVYETWMQHRAWIAQAEQTARQESQLALQKLADSVKCVEPSLLVVNPTIDTRLELLEYKDKNGHIMELPALLRPLSYEQIPLKAFSRRMIKRTKSATPPKISNSFYSLEFGQDGTVIGITDKIRYTQLLMDGGSGANQLIYTEDNHKTFHSPRNPEFTIENCDCFTRVIVKSTLDELGAEIIQTVTLLRNVPRIDLETRIVHARAMVNTDRYKRFIYIAFPFEVPDAKRYVALNGCIAEFGKDITGHGTDTYMPARHNVFIENGKTNIAFTQMDSNLVEFGHIHADKTDFGGDGSSSRLFSYVANDWLQMHTHGGSHLDFKFRYSIMTYDESYKKDNYAKMGDELFTPYFQCIVMPHPGFLDKSTTFMDINKLSVRLLTMKCADDGNGFIVRLQETAGKNSEIPADFAQWSSVTVDEGTPVRRQFNFVWPFEIVTLKLATKSLQLRKEETRFRTDGIPEDIGCVYTGLIDTPCAAPGAEDGQLYLLWGQNPEQDVQSYELHRSKEPDFTPSDATLVANVPRGEYCVARYEDTGLETHTTYYYRLRAVSVSGAKGKFSKAFAGITREMQV